MGWLQRWLWRTPSPNVWSHLRREVPEGPQAGVKQGRKCKAARSWAPSPVLLLGTVLSFSDRGGPAFPNCLPVLPGSSSPWPRHHSHLCHSFCLSFKAQLPPVEIQGATQVPPATLPACTISFRCPCDTKARAACPALQPLCAYRRMQTGCPHLPTDFPPPSRGSPSSGPGRQAPTGAGRAHLLHPSSRTLHQRPPGTCPPPRRASPHQHTHPCLDCVPLLSSSASWYARTIRQTKKPSASFKNRLTGHRI